MTDAQRRGSEGRQDRDDRELDELLAELRVFLPGVTVLFAFLLSLPFTSRFGDLTDFQTAAFVVAFLTVAAALVLALGETGYHRARGKPYDKSRMIRTVGHQLLAALVLLLIGLVAVVYLVIDVLGPGTSAAVASAALAALALATWFGLPLLRRHRS